MTIPSVLRLAEHEALSKITLSGKVLDLGGTRNAEYHSFFKGSFDITTVNLDKDAAPDLFHDLEKPIPFPNESFDHVLLINVLEHIFEYRQLLREAVRAVKPAGQVVIAVPYLLPIHPSPRDFWRFSNQALEEECRLAGLKVEILAPLGTGVFSARYLLLDRLLPSPLRLISFYTARYIMRVQDYLFTHVARAFGKRYLPEEYALGYILCAKKIS